MTTTAEINLIGLMTTLLPAGVRPVLAAVGEGARQTGARPYLVGGAVRDLLLGRPTTDLDLTVEGDTAALAGAVAAALGARATVYPEFGTATLHLPWRTWAEVGDPTARLPEGVDGLHVDLATTRTERYPRPGALPVVQPGADLTADLRRRDFTLNAMAVALAADDAGRLLDPYGGVADLAAGRLAVLHPASFVDDATRLVRGVRLAGRLLLRFAPETEALARAAVAEGWLAALSAERRRHELELLLQEERPGPALAMARVLGILEQLHPSLRWDAWTAERLRRSVPWVEALPRVRVRLALLAYRWSPETIEDAVTALQPDGATAEALRALPEWRTRRERLPAGTGSALVRALAGLPAATLAAARLAEDEPVVAPTLDWYITDGRARRPRLGGDALRQLGLPPGPRYRPILEALWAAVQDDLLPDEAAEWAFLRQLVEADGVGGGAAGGDEERRGDADAELRDGQSPPAGGGAADARGGGAAL